MLSKGSTNVKKDAFFDYLVLGGSGRVRDKETISKERKVKAKRTREQSESGKRNKKNKTVQSQEVYSTAVDEHIEKEQALMTRWLNPPAAVPVRDNLLGWSIFDNKAEWMAEEDLERLAESVCSSSPEHVGQEWDLGLNLLEDKDDLYCSEELDLGKEEWEWGVADGKVRKPSALEDLFKPKKKTKELHAQRPLRSIFNVKRKLKLEWVDTSPLPERWPWSMHWSLTDRDSDDRVAKRISAVHEWAAAHETEGTRLLVGELAEAGFDIEDCMWREMMIEWYNSTDTQYMPVALCEIGERVIDQRERVPAHIPVEERERRFAKIVAKWRALPTTFHYDQLNLTDLGQRLGGHVQRACLQLGGLMSFDEAEIISNLIHYTANQGGTSILTHDIETSYMQCLCNTRINLAGILPVIDDQVDLDLPFAPSANWRRTDNTWCLLQDGAIDGAGRLEKWCVQKWGEDEIGSLKEFLDTPTKNLRDYDKTLFWARRSWNIIWKGTLDYLLPIARDLLISIAGPPIADVEDMLNLEERVKAWRRLPL
jgi:hypothetical protein